MKATVRITAAQDPDAKPRRVPLVAMKDLMWWIYLYPLRGLAGMLPPRWFRASAGLLEPVFQALASRPRQLVKKQMQRAIDATGREFDVDLAARRFIANAAWRGIDDLILNRLVARGELTTGKIEGIEHLHEARAQGRGAIILSGHFYANRIAKRYLAEEGFSMMSVRNRTPPDPLMGRFGRDHMQPGYVRFLEGVIQDEIFMQDQACSLKILQRLRNGGLVNIHLDAPFSRAIVERPFLGITWPFPMGFLEIVRKTGVPVVPMVCLGNSRGFRIRFEEPFELVSAHDAEAFVAANLQTLVTRLESWIVEFPDQWDLWIRL